MATDLASSVRPALPAGAPATLFTRWSGLRSLIFWIGSPESHRSSLAWIDWQGRKSLTAPSKIVFGRFGQEIEAGLLFFCLITLSRAVFCFIRSWVRSSSLVLWDCQSIGKAGVEGTASWSQEQDSRSSFHRNCYSQGSAHNWKHSPPVPPFSSHSNQPSKSSPFCHWYWIQTIPVFFLRSFSIWVWESSSDSKSAAETRWNRSGLLFYTSPRSTTETFGKRQSSSRCWPWNHFCCLRFRRTSALSRSIRPFLHVRILYGLLEACGPAMSSICPGLCGSSCLAGR